MRELVSRLVKFAAEPLCGHGSCRFWAAPEASLGPLGGSWAPPWGLLAASWGALGTLWGSPGASQGAFWGLLAPLGALLGHPGDDVQKKTQNRPPRWPIWGPKMGPKWDPKRTKIEDKIERQKSTSLRASWGDLGSIWVAPGAQKC